ncbi:OprO/OprP family phosphate-selective porin [Arenicella chitinivorans]|uniref:OprO/OprP family phosphate-selective porin n=1 Tax=Arenicella chitinivorans TaxID=1329800 RepID=UPI0016744E72|nr:porin [Arenicella chitinivorans]
MYRNISTHVILVLSLISGCPVVAVAEDSLADIRALVNAQERQLNELKARLARLEAVAATGLKVGSKEDSKVGAVTGATKPVVSPASGAMAWAGASPQFSQPESESQFKFRGKFQTEIMATRSDIETTDYGRASEIRRVRLGAQGAFSPSLDYVAELDFGGDKIGYEDIFVRYRMSDHTAIRLGHHEASVSLDDETSDSNHSFLERSLHNSLSLGRSVGLGFETQGQRWSLNAGLFGQSQLDTEVGESEGWKAATRLMWTPLHNSNHTWHLGAASYYVSLGEEDYRVSARPESHQLAALFDTGEHAANDVKYVGLEAAFQHHSLLFQAEFGEQTVDYTQLDESRFVTGYAQAAWLISGEQRNYDRSRGKFGGVVPATSWGEGGKGALELALRSSHMDLVSGDISGGKGSTLSVGLNWYPKSFLRLSANWVHFEIDNSLEVLPQGYATHKGNAFAVRSQVTW